MYLVCIDEVQMEYSKFIDKLYVYKGICYEDNRSWRFGKSFLYCVIFFIYQDFYV